MSRFTPATILSEYSALSALNDNFTQIATVLDDLLSRSGSGTNSMSHDLDLNHNKVQNLQDAVNPTDAVNMGQVNNLIATLAGIQNTLAGFAAGNQTAVGGVSAKVNWKIDDTTLVQSFGSLWSNPIIIDHGICHTFSASDVLSAGSPAVGFLSAAKNTGTTGDVVGHMSIGTVSAANKTAFGENIIVYSSGGVNGCKLVGLEIDVQPQAGTTPSTASGLYINAFNAVCPGPAIYIEGLAGGKFSTGINIGNLDTNGAGIAPALGTPHMNCLVDTGTAVYNTAAIALSNTHRMIFRPASGNPGQLYVDGTNFFHLVLPTAGLAVRDTTDANTVLLVDSSGALDMQGGGTVKFAGALSTSSATAGANTLPANPVGFITVVIGGTNRKIPYYAT